MPASIWITFILSIIFVLVGGHLIITRVYPHIKNLLEPIIKDEKIINSLMSLLIILVIIFVADKLVKILTSTDNKYLDTFNILSPALEILMKLTIYLGILIVATLIIYGVKKKQGI